MSAAERADVKVDDADWKAAGIKSGPRRPAQYAIQRREAKALLC